MSLDLCEKTRAPDRNGHRENMQTGEGYITNVTEFDGNRAFHHLNLQL